MAEYKVVYKEWFIIQTWQDIKKNTKTKAVVIKRHVYGNGGGEPSQQMTIADTEVLEMISLIQINGIENIKEMPLTF